MRKVLAWVKAIITGGMAYIVCFLIIGDAEKALIGTAIFLGLFCLLGRTL